MRGSQVAWTGRRIVKGKAIGPACLSRQSISFLGDIDIKTGRVVGQSSDLAGRTVKDTVLVVQATRGSAGAWRFLYQMKQHGTHPAAIITQDLPDPSVVQGAILSAIPIVSGLAHAICEQVADGTMLEVDATCGYVRTLDECEIISFVKNVATRTDR